MKKHTSRRQFLRTAAIGAASMAVPRQWSSAQTSLKEQPADGPNLIFVFADQWRAQATGYAGNKAVKTPNLDKLAEESVNFTNAVSGCPVCSPYRASLLTGRYWLTHGIFYNDKPLNPDATTIGKVYRQAGYKTAYIGKWHVDGHGRSSFIPKERRQGFEFWRVCECTHDYNHSLYYGDVPEKKYWPGYDAIAQTREAQQYIRQHANSSTSSPSKSPFALFVSWGPPHNPYQTAPEKYRKMFPDPSEIPLRPNVPDSLRSQAQEELAGYYAHIAALDDCIGDILSTIDECGIEKNTIFVFTSDHGDMLHSHGQTRKQKPWEESVRVPFIVRYPAAHGKAGRRVDMPINTPDIMPTLLGLSGLAIPKSVEGGDFSGVVTGTRSLDNDAALIMCPVPFHEWGYRRGGREYRGVRTRRYTYVRDLNGPWLLYDNQADPYQLMNLCNSPENAQIQQELEKQLSRRLEETNDKFLTGSEYMALWNYQWDANDGPTSQK